MFSTPGYASQTMPRTANDNQRKVYRQATSRRQTARDLGARFLDDRRAVLHRELPSGLPITLTLPLSAYDCIAIRLMKDARDPDRLTARLELVHNDPALCIVVAEADCPSALAEDWADWADMADLPLRMIDLEGDLHTPPSEPSVAIGPPSTRRFGKETNKRRTRFQNKRNCGVAGDAKPLRGDEIIARS